ncbi:MAG: response regulator transcription factor [Actinomycetes bacterium]
MRLLIVEDDVKLVRALKRGLALEGYAVDVARTGDDGLSKATSEDYDAVVLDLMLPGLDGFAVCEELRRRERWAPVLMLTARADVRDRIRGLDGGADDYLVKPFDFGELLARLRVLTRRGPSAHPLVLEIGDLHVDSSTRVVSRAGRQVELTAREFDVLEVLARNRGRLVSRNQLLDEVWHEGYPGSPNVVDVYIGYLRKKLERPRGRRLIRTVRGKGFLLESQ